MNKKEYLISFIIGSSVLVTFITLLYLGRAFNNSGRPSEIPYEKFALAIPIIYGISNVINIYLQKNYSYSSNISFGVGAIMGLFLSFIGRFKYNLPKEIFKFSEKNAYQVHIIAPVLYSLIFGLIVQSVNSYILV